MLGRRVSIVLYLQFLQKIEGLGGVVAYDFGKKLADGSLRICTLWIVHLGRYAQRIPCLRHNTKSAKTGFPNTSTRCSRKSVYEKEGIHLPRPVG
jgi:hypothetical protein